MQDLLSIGTNRRESMIGTGIGLGLAGYRLRTSFEAMPSLDLQFADRRMIQAVLGPTPSFSRASTGTYFDGQGILQTAAVNGPRFDHVYNGTSWVSKGLLIEEQRTNSFYYSESASNLGMINASVTSNAYTAPDGTQTADTIIPDTGAYNHGAQLYENGDGTNWAVSCFAKANGYRYFSITVGSASALFDLTGGVYTGTSSGSPLGYGVTNVGNGWYRVWVSSATVNGSPSPIQLLISNSSSVISPSFSGNNVDGVLVWGMQREKSASFPTSYIKNMGGGSTTRSADVCQITGGDFSGFWNGTEGSVACEFDVSSGYTSSAMTIVNFYQSGSSWIGFRSIESTSNNVFDCYSGGVQQARLGFSRSNPGISARLAAAFKANDFAASQNGSAVLTDTSGSLPSPTYLELGTFTGFGEYLNGHIARLRYYPTRLTNAKLQELST